MQKAIKILNQLVAEGLIEDYAIGGSVAMLFYAEPVTTKDVDIFIETKSNSLIVSYSPIYAYLKNLGYEMIDQHVVIEGIAIDFLPAYNPLVMEALNNANTMNYSGENVDVFTPEYIIAIALQTGRPQDYQKITILLNEAEINQDKLIEILKKYSLYQKWISFISKKD